MMKLSSLDWSGTDIEICRITASVPGTETAEVKRP